jgi:hypothetical protein
MRDAHIRYIVREGLPFIKEMAIPEHRRRYNRLSGRSKERCIKIITIRDYYSNS